MFALLVRLLHPFTPPIATARNYSVRKFRGDMIAGLTVAVVEVPQAMAYAMIAGVPPQYGLYTSIIQGFFGALFASNEHLSSGATNTQSLLIAATVIHLVPNGEPMMYLQLVIALTMIKGIIQLIFAAARMGNLIRYVSRSVIVGFSAGAGVLIAAGQIPNLLGLARDQLGERVAPGVIGDVLRVIPHFHEASPYALMIGVGTLFLILMIRSISRLAPGPLLGVVCAGACVAIAGWGPDVLPLVGELPKGLPEVFVAPWNISYRQAEAMLGGAFALALLGMIETVAIGKSIGAHTGTAVSPNQEFFAQGLANVLGAFCQNIPGSASFTRSALNHQAGGITRFAGVYSAIAVAVIYLTCGSLAWYIPLAALAGVLFVIAYSLIDWRYMLRVRRVSQGDAAVCMVTFFAAITLPLHYAIYVGVFLNIALYMQQSSRLRMAEMVRSPAGPFVEQPLQEKHGQRTVLFLQMEGDLFFGVADELRDRLTRIRKDSSRVVIFRLKRTHSIDSTVLQVMEEFTKRMNETGRHVILCGVRDELMEVIGHYGLDKLIGEDNVFPTTYGVFASAQKALDRAKVLIGGSIDASDIADHDDLEYWAYEI
ncbi:MAG: SulP family inorganic anion transporter [Phycisphaeraceae bacterium]|nr:SulP family inorganic anion transporter [Phycisphaeraceae bacterium]